MNVPSECRFCGNTSPEVIEIQVHYKTARKVGLHSMMRVECSCGAISKCRPDRDSAIDAWNEPWQAFVKSRKSEFAALTPAGEDEAPVLDGNEIWEALFGIMKGNVPDALTVEVCEQLATGLRAALSRPNVDEMREALQPLARAGTDMHGAPVGLTGQHILRARAALNGSGK